MMLKNYLSKYAGIHSYQPPIPPLSGVPTATALNEVGQKDLADSNTKKFPASQVADSPHISKFIVVVSNGQLRL